MIKFVKGMGAVPVMAAVAIVGCAATAAAQSASSADFPDVPQNHWAYQAVHDLADKGLVKGYPDGKFLGDRAMTRFEFATVVERLLETVDDMKAGSTPTSGVTQDDLNKIQVLVDKFQPQLDAIQANVTKAQSDIDTLRQNLDDLRQDVEDAKGVANKAQDTANNSYGFGSKRKFQITGYIQARYVTASSSNVSNPGKLEFPQGKAASSSAYNGSYMAGANSATPEVRRSRLVVTGQVTQNTNYRFQLDASSSNTNGASYSPSNSAQVTVREGNINYTFNDGNPAHNLTLTAGIFANPFGYDLPLSSSAILSPERPLIVNETGNGLFNGQDYDKGAEITYPKGRTKITVAAVSGEGYGTGTFPGTDTDRNLDQIYKVNYVFGPKLAGGLSYYYGRIGNTTSAANPPYVSMRKQLKDIDLEYTPSKSIFVNGEAVSGIFEQRYAFASATTVAALAPATVAAPHNTVGGYYVQGGYIFSPTGSHPLTLAASYDVLQRATGGVGKDATYDDVNLGYGLLYALDGQTRVRVWYIQPTAVAHTPTSPDPTKVGLLTTELQVKF